MANICEKLIEEVSSDSASLSPELQSHVLTCPECQQNLAAIKNLKSARKGFSAKEAAAVAAIVGAVKQQAAASASAAKIGASATLPVGTLLKALAVLVVLTLGFSFAFGPGGREVTPANSAAQTQNADTESLTVDQPQQETKDAAATSAVASEIRDEKADDVATSPANVETNWQNPAEKDKIDATTSTIVSPDQEELNIR